MVITRERWLEVLTKSGVGMSAILRFKWHEVFAANVQPNRFNLGLEEMDDFTAQALHETGNLEHLEENLNFRPETLQRVWPARFPSAAKAIQYAFQPEKLANEVYGGRMGNSEWGDGWKYRGRGIPMITGKANYQRLQELLALPLVDKPDLLLDPAIAIQCGIVWWEANIPDDAIDTMDRQTRIVNGGLVGLEDRRLKYRKVHKALEDIQ